MNNHRVNHHVFTLQTERATNYTIYVVK